MKYRNSQLLKSQAASLKKHQWAVLCCCVFFSACTSKKDTSPESDNSQTKAETQEEAPAPKAPPTAWKGEWQIDIPKDPIDAGGLPFVSSAQGELRLKKVQQDDGDFSEKLEGQIKISGESFLVQGQWDKERLSAAFSNEILSDYRGSLAAHLEEDRSLIGTFRASRADSAEILRGKFQLKEDLAP